MTAVCFEENLATMFQQDDGDGTLVHLSFAEKAGLSGRIHDWLQRRSEAGPKWFGWKSVDEIESFWSVLCDGNPSRISRAVQASTSVSLNSLIVPLALLGRADLVDALHQELPRSESGGFAETAGLELGSCGEWQWALAILERAHQGDARPAVSRSIQGLMWKYAYLQGHVDTVLPRLAAIPFNPEISHAAEARKWELVTHQIRAGKRDVRVPVIESGDQPAGYLEAAATQIAAFEGIPGAEETVRELRRVLKPRTITALLADRGFQVSLSVEADRVFRAEVRIAAARKDYARLSMLAQTDTHSLTVAPDVVIDALLEEGDWRAADDIAQRYDVRERPVIEGFDDSRLDEYWQLQLILMGAAVQDGDDAAANSYLARYIEGLQALRAAQEADEEARDFVDPPRDLQWPWRQTLLAGAAEGLIPRRYLAPFFLRFRSAY